MVSSSGTSYLNVIRRTSLPRFRNSLHILTHHSPQHQLPLHLSSVYTLRANFLDGRKVAFRSALAIRKNTGATFAEFQSHVPSRRRILMNAKRFTRFSIGLLLLVLASF